DVDDTALVCCALNLVNLDNNHLKNQAIKEGVDWVLNMQNHDGSWAAFDKNNYRKLLKHIPYADFITPLDFGSPDITAHVLYVLGQLKNNLDTRVIGNAFKYLTKSQQTDGSWYGRWGVNYLYGTSKVLQAFDSLKNIPNLNLYRSSINKTAVKAFQWLQNCQNPDGGWSESCQSFEMEKYIGLNESTPSQTAWALSGLLALNKFRIGNNSSVNTIINRGINYLLNVQNINGSWEEEYFTGGGFPRAFYLKYEMYKDYFPLIALAKYKKLTCENKL
ncbi:MAG: squalene--hopene cyclase, partial [Actinobacteria bacterium]|nr:squalene--hopene cyclase [Actinomycetota bacterium]